jgi:hypothetical protein
MWVSSNTPIKKPTMGINEKFRDKSDIRDAPMQKKPAYISAFFKGPCISLGIVSISSVTDHKECDDANKAP